jgi:ribosomal protein S18
MPLWGRSPSAVHQRELVEAIKRARNIALLPFATD